MLPVVLAAMLAQRLATPRADAGRPPRQDRRPILVAIAAGLAALSMIFLLAIGTLLPPAAVCGLLLATPLLALVLPIAPIHRQRLAAGLFLALSLFWFVQAWTTVQLNSSSGWWYLYNRSPAAGTYETGLVAGFPIWGIEGSSGGSFPGYLPWDRGLGVLLLNFAIFAGVAWFLTSWIPRRALGWVIGLTSVTAAAASAFGTVWMLCITD